MPRTLAIASALALIALSPAQAVTKTATFYFGGSLKDLGPTESYSNNGLDLTVHAFNLEDTGQARLVRSSYGLGVDSSAGPGFDAQWWLLDDIKEAEALVFHFDPSVKFRSVQILFDDWNDDLNFFASNDDSILDSTNIGQSAFRSKRGTSVLNTYGSAGGGLDWVDLSGLAGTWEYLAVYGGKAENNEARIKRLKVEYEHFDRVVEEPGVVPVPFGLPLLVSAFGLAAVVRRRATG